MVDVTGSVLVEALEAGAAVVVDTVAARFVHAAVVTTIASAEAAAPARRNR